MNIIYNVEDLTRKINDVYDGFFSLGAPDWFCSSSRQRCNDNIKHSDGKLFDTGDILFEVGMLHNLVRNATTNYPELCSKVRDLTLEFEIIQSAYFLSRKQ